MTIIQSISEIAVSNGTQIASNELVAKHAALNELRSLQATLAADDIKVNWKELRKRYSLSEIANEQACRNPDRFGLVSADTLADIIEIFEANLDPLPDGYAAPVPRVDAALSDVDRIRVLIAAIPARDLSKMTVRRPMSQNAVQLELATGLHEVMTSESYIAENCALLTADLNSVVDNQVVVVPAGTIVAISSDNMMQICEAVLKGRAQFSDSPERITAQASARERLENDLREAEVALVAAEAVAEAARQEAERVRLATPVAVRFRKGGIVAINDATRELLTVLAAEGLAELVLPDA